MLNKNVYKQKKLTFIKFQDKVGLLNEDGFGDVLKLYHDSAAHPGINSTIKAIKQKYFWPGLTEDVTKCVSNWLQMTRLKTFCVFVAEKGPKLGSFRANLIEI